MKYMLFSGIAAAGLLSFAAPADASDSTSLDGDAVTASEVMELSSHGSKGAGGMKPGLGTHRPGSQHVGFRPRPGFHGIPRTDVYRRPHRGFILPRYWVQPTFYLSNFGSYGLSAPLNGYYWSRYYDDAVLTDQRGYVQDYRSDVNWDDGYQEGQGRNGPDRTGDYREPEYHPSMRPDTTAYNWNDDVTFAAPDGSSYSYDGDWDGKYVDPQGRVFEGEWSGQVTRQDGVTGPGYPAPHPSAAPYPAPDYDEEAYDVPQGYESYERCLKSNGLKGAAIGALLGGVAGNRIAGRGDRTGGTLIGAGIGGLLGVAAEKAGNKCRHYRPRDPRPSVGYPQPNYGHSWQGGYYYYQQAPVVTVTVVPGSTHTTTTVTEEVYYETAKTYPRKKAVRKWKPKPKPRCICR